MLRGVGEPFKTEFAYESEASGMEANDPDVSLFSDDCRCCAIVLVARRTLAGLSDKYAAPRFGLDNVLIFLFKVPGVPI